MESRMANLEERTTRNEVLPEVSPLSFVDALGEVAIVVHDGQGKILQVNPCFCRMFGYTPREAIGKDLDPLVARGEELVDALALSERYYDSGKGFSLEVTRYKKDGTPFQVLLTSTPMYIDRSGRRSVNTCTYVDLTGKRERERAMKKARVLFENLFDRTPSAVVLCDIESRIIRGNAAFFELFGYAPEEMEGQIIDGLVARGPYYEEAQSISAIVYSGEGHQRRTVRFRKDGTPIDVTITAIPFTTEDGERMLFGIYYDISAEKEAERRIETYEAELRHLAWEISLSEERERRKVASILHDEIGFELASLYQSLTANASSSQEGHPLQAATDSLKGVIAQIRCLTREISNPALYAAGLDVGLRSLLDQILTPLGIRWSLSVNGSSRELPQDLGVVLYQMVRELVRNVVKHASARSVSVRVRYRRHSIAVQVKDDGVGSTASENSIGLELRGWGLFGIRERLRHLGGRLAFRSAPGEGTRCTMWIPKKGGDSFADTGLHS